MSYGMQLFDEAGSVILDTSSFTYQVIFTAVVDFRAATGNETRTYSIPDFDPTKCCAVMLPIDDYTVDYGDYWNSCPYIKQSELTAGSIKVYNYRPEYNDGMYTKTRVTLMVLRFA